MLTSTLCLLTTFKCFLLALFSEKTGNLVTL